MSGPRVFLQSVTRISRTSVLLEPQEGETLDFRTINCAPPSHRSVLQKNGLIAKVCIGVTFTGSGNNDMSADEFKDYIYSFEGRLKLWRNALIKGKLIDENAASSVHVPSALAKEAWPLLTDEEFNQRMHYFAERKKCSEVHTSSFCVPSVSLQQVFYKEPGLKASVGVIWMPRYKYDLIEWCDYQLNSGRWVPEQHLTTLVHHVTVGLSAIQKLVGEMNTISANAFDSGKSVTPVVLSYCPVTFEMEDILVHEEDNAPVFSVSLSPLSNNTKIAAAVADKENDFAQLGLYPYLAPEQVCPTDTPVRMQRFDVWALGAIVHAIASGTPSLASQLKRQVKRRNQALPMNHPSATPADVMRRIRRDIEAGGYSSALASLLSLLLSIDHLTRPSWPTVDRMMQDLNRAMPIFRFPFVVGSYDLLRLPTSDLVQLNPNARKYITSDICCVCKRERNLAFCKVREHAPAVTSPSWTCDELLPGISVPNDCCYMSYLYPLMPPMANERDTRRLILQAMPRNNPNGSCNSNLDSTSINLGQLFQLFGGFAMYEKRLMKDGKERAVMREVLVPFPSNSLRKGQSTAVVQQLNFCAAQPWPSQCTQALQRRGRISRQVPFMFGGGHSAVKWFAWLVPEETFTLENGEKWMPAPDGGFVFWFNEMLEPSDQDRYFPITSVRSLTVQAKVQRTVLPDHIFKQNIVEDLSQVNCMHLSLTAGEGALISPQKSHSMARRHSTQSIRLVEMPQSEGILEADDAVRLSQSGRVSPSSIMRSADRDKNSLRDSPLSTARSNTAPHRPLTKGRVPTVRIDMLRDSNTLEPLAEKPLGMEAVPMSSAESRPPKAGGGVHTPMSQSAILRTTSHNVKTAPTDLSSARRNSSGNAASARSTSEPLVPLDPNRRRVSGDKKLFGSIQGSSSCTPKHALGDINDSLADCPVQVSCEWLPASLIDAPYDSLTFTVNGTDEHGLLQRPMMITSAVRRAVGCPANAQYMSFAANSLPLIRRNHSGFKCAACTESVLPHHGFVLYSDDGAVVALMALHCTMKGGSSCTPNRNASQLPLMVLPPITGMDVNARNILAAYLPVSASEPQPPVVTLSSHRRPAGGAHHETVASHHLRHSDTQGWRNSNNSAIISPINGGNYVAWVGFDPERGALMFGDVDQSTWYPFVFAA